MMFSNSSMLSEDDTGLSFFIAEEVGDSFEGLLQISL